MKKRILDLIQDSGDTGHQSSKDSMTDSFHKLDWNRATDKERPWVKFALKDITRQLTSMINVIGFESMVLHDLWYQQYGKEGAHGWHVHGHNFTGVYYLEFDETNPLTQLLDPLDLNKCISKRVVEGDFIMFPCHIIHRSSENLSDERKTIISFNFDCGEIKPELLKDRRIKYIH